MIKFDKPAPYVSSGKDAQTIGIDALTFFASEPKLLDRFFELTGLSIQRLRGEAKSPAFFVGLFDFLLANEDDLLDFASFAGLDPSEVQRARDALRRETRR